MFLDLLLAARDRLHLSYAGRSVRDNSPRPASVLVAELLETLVPALAHAPASAASRADARRALVVEHPLQPFAAAGLRRRRARPARCAASRPTTRWRCGKAWPRRPRPPRRVDDGDDDWEAHDDEVRGDLAAPFIAGPLPPVDDDWRDVPLARLAAFFRNPCRFLLEQRLGVALRREDEELQDDEPFVPDNSGRAPLTRLLLPALLEGLPPEAARTLALAGTAVPTGGFGMRFLERELNGLREFAEQVREHTLQPALPPHAVDDRRSTSTASRGACTASSPTCARAACCAIATRSSRRSTTSTPGCRTCCCASARRPACCP